MSNPRPLEQINKSWLDDRGVDRRIFINQGWKSMGERRGYLTRHDENGVYVRKYLADRPEGLVFVPYAEVRTVHLCGGKMFDYVDAVVAAEMGD